MEEPPVGRPPARHHQEVQAADKEADQVEAVCRHRPVGRGALLALHELLLERSGAHAQV